MSIYHGEVNVTTSAQELPSTPPGKVWFRTLSTNSGKVYVGNDITTVTVPDGSTNTTAGFEMTEGEVWGPLNIDGGLDTLSVIGTDADDSLLYFVVA